VTIQNYPGEVVWLDGSVPVTGWVKSGAVWVKSGWTPRFDHTPSYTKGTADGTASGWKFLNPAYPMAAHPDQVFVDGVALQQVDSLSKVTTGTFYLDEVTSELSIGSDPTGKQVRASDLAKAISVRYDNVVLRGFGVRRYANSVWHIGAITLERPGDVVENMVVNDNATIGIGVTNKDITLSNVTAERNGMLGVTAGKAYNFTMAHSRFIENNDERFNSSPASGGVKIGRSRGLTIKNNSFIRNFSKGLWMDESVYDAKVIGNNIVENTSHGLSFEISSRGVFANNLVLRNKGAGFKINDSDKIELWNNTFVGNGRAVNLVQDTRRGYQTSTPGHDPQQPNPDPTMSWILGDITLYNNVISNAGGVADCMVCVEDYSHEFAAQDMRLKYSGNLYNRPADAPTRFAIWSTGAGSPSAFLNLTAFRTATGQDTGSVLYDGTTVVASDGVVSTSNTAGAVPLPSTTATLVGQPVGTKALGAWLGR